MEKERKTSEIDVAYYKQMVEKAKEANKAYYDNDDPIMTDIEYDELMQKIKAFETAHPDVVTADSPTQYVGGTASKSSFARVKHVVPMLSLQDVFSKSEVYAFLGKFTDDTRYCVEEKIDGLSLSVTYENGFLVRAETRGDGHTYGEDVTENAKHVRGIPLALNPTHSRQGRGIIKTLEVRCEVYLPVDAFMALNEQKESRGEKLFANPRNAAAGLLRTKKTKDMKDAGLCAFAFNVQRVELTGDLNSRPGPSVPALGAFHWIDLHTLQELGFATVKHYTCDVQGVINMIERIERDRANLPYWIDGAVVKLDSIEERKEAGETAKYPLWAVAYKYPPEEKETVIRNIVLQTGRTGRVTPVAIFDPVYLAGTRVTKSTLHNPEFVEGLGVNIGDTVLVRKAAEIIPEVIKVVTKNSNGVYDVLQHVCPSCGGKLVAGADENGDNCSGAYCTNINCPAQTARKFEFWASRECMDIRGFGPAQIDKFIEKGWLQRIPDIYRLKDHMFDMMQMEGLGERAVKNILTAIEESKDRDIDRLVKSLGIAGVGRHVGKLLAERYENFYALELLTEEELEKIEGIGGITARTFCSALRDYDNMLMIRDLDRLGVNLKSKSYGKTPFDESGAYLLGLTFVITGTLPTMKREEAAALIEAAGGKVAGSVSKKTDYLICGENAGSKLDKAKALGTKIINEEEFKKMLEEQN